MTTYKNRYGDIYTFTEDANHDILWEGDFKYTRFGYANDYTKSYNAYVADGGKLSFNEFKAVVHNSDEHNKYHRLVESRQDLVDMIDPSGGPYIAVGMDLKHFGYEGYIVKGFEPIMTGEKIIVEKCFYCTQPAGKHKMSCLTQKRQINL